MPNNKETILETKETLPKETSLDYIEEIPVVEIPNYLQGVLTRGSIQGERINVAGKSLFPQIINTEGNLIKDIINARLDTAAKQILGDFTFGTSGAIKMITDANNGLWLSPTGILGKKAGATTFSITTSGDATFAGELSATFGTLGALTVASGGNIKQGQTAYNTETGFWLGDDAGTPKLSIGNPVGNYMTWDGSVLAIRGNLERKDIHWLTYFESKDGFEAVIDNDGYVTVWGGHIKIGSGTISGNETYFRKYHDYGAVIMTWNKNRTIKTKVYFASNTNQTIWITSGEDGVGPHIGFKVLNDVLYGTVEDTIAESTLNCGNISAGTAYELKIVFETGSKATFYVDGVDKGNITTNLPSGIQSSGYLIWLSIKTGEAVAKEIRLSYWDFWQAS